MENQHLAFNMCGYVIRFDTATHSWNWTKWDYADNGPADGNRRVVRRSGGLEFMKMFPSVFGSTQPSGNAARVTEKEDMEAALKKQGVDFIFLYQGEVVEEEFSSVKEAEKVNGVESFPMWELTHYWFSYDANIQSWAMYDALSGQLEFTPATAAKRLENKSTRIAKQRSQSYASTPVDAAYAGTPQNVTYH